MFYYIFLFTIYYLPDVLFKNENIDVIKHMECVRVGVQWERFYII